MSASFAMPCRSAFTLMELLAVMLLILTILGMGVPLLMTSERKNLFSNSMATLSNAIKVGQEIQREMYARGDFRIVRISILGQRWNNADDEYYPRVVVELAESYDPNIPKVGQQEMAVMFAKRFGSGPFFAGDMCSGGVQTVSPKSILFPTFKLDEDLFISAVYIDNCKFPVGPGVWAPYLGNEMPVLGHDGFADSFSFSFVPETGFIDPRCFYDQTKPMEFIFGALPKVAGHPSTDWWTRRAFKETKILRLYAQGQVEIK